MESINNVIKLNIKIDFLLSITPCLKISLDPMHAVAQTATIEATGGCELQKVAAFVPCFPLSAISRVYSGCSRS